MRKTILFLSLALLVLSSGCKFDRVSGSGTVKVDKRSVPAFTAVDISGAYDVEIVAQKEQSLEIEGDDNVLPLIKTEVKNGVLEISNEKSFNTKQKLRVRISLPKLDGIETSGASDTIFMKFLSRSSRATGPNTRVPIGVPSSLMSTAAF